MNPDNGKFRLPLTAVITAGVIVAGGFWMAERSASNALGAMPAEATAEYGRYLLRETAEYLGPSHENPEMRYTGTHLACASCHLDIGERPGTLSLLETSTRYPRDSGRDGGMRDLRDRINGCMQRSMNGRPLPRDSIEMIAMEKYINRLGDQYAAMSVVRKTPIEPQEFAEPDRRADVDAGRVVYEQRCYVCHGQYGEGLRATANLNDGYVFPPLWGPDSFNDGAGMHRVLTAARFIKARMPFGQPDLTNDQAFDVSAYINSHPRPQMSDLEKDFPDRSRKHVDSPYPPYADDFPHEQHKYGPFRPIREYYQRQEDPPE
jgi:thiosulfate dehydrogenase